MKMSFKRIISVTLTLIIALCMAFPAGVGATGSMLGGNCGADAYWTIYTDNVLAITGKARFPITAIIPRIPQTKPRGQIIMK